MSITTQNNPLANPVQTGTPQPTTSNYVLGSLNKPDISDMATFKYGKQYQICALLDRLTRSKESTQQTFQWFEFGFTRKQYTVGNGSTLTNGASTITVKILNSDLTSITTAPVLVPTMTVRFENNSVGRITTVTHNGSDVDVVIAPVGASTWVTSGGANYNNLPATGNKFAQAYSTNVEFSDAPNPITWNPELLNNYITTNRRTVRCSTTENSNMKWIKDPKTGKNYYYFINESIAMEETMKDKEMLYLMGVQSQSATTPTNAGSSLGLIPNILSRGSVTTYSGALQVSDIEEQIRLMLISNGSTSNEWVVFAGSQWLQEANQALRFYLLNGAVSYAAAEALKSIKLNFQSYGFMGGTLHLVHYKSFDNPTLFPTPAGSGNINFSKAALFLNMGNDTQGNPLLQERYQVDANGVAYKFIRKVAPGMSAPEPATTMNNLAVNGLDGFSVFFLSATGLEMRAANSHGFQFAA